MSNLVQDCNRWPCRCGSDPYASALDRFSKGHLSSSSIRNISKEDVLAYAQRSGAVGNDQLCTVMYALLTGRIDYWHKTPGDCGDATSISLSGGVPGAVTKAGGLATVGLQAAAPLLGGAAAVPIIGLAILPFAIWGLISRHHKIEVAKDEQEYCDVSNAYNQWEATMEQGLQSGQLALADVKASVPQVEQQLIAALRVRTKGQNAGYYYQLVVKALDLYMVEKGYDALAPKSIKSSLSSLASAITGGTGGGSNFAKYGVAAAAGTVAAVVV